MAKKGSITSRKKNSMESMPWLYILLIMAALGIVVVSLFSARNRQDIRTPAATDSRYMREEIPGMFSNREVR